MKGYLKHLYLWAQYNLVEHIQSRKWGYAPEYTRPFTPSQWIERLKWVAIAHERRRANNKGYTK